MSAPAQILLWWILFAGTHVGGSSRAIRSRLIAAFGLPGFKGVYSLVSFATLFPLILVFWPNRMAPPLWDPGWSAGLLTELLMLAAFVFIAEGYATPHPMTTLAELTGRRGGTALGIQRVTRHPVNTGFALYGLAHALANPSPEGLLFFGGLPVFSLVSGHHQDERTAAASAQAERFQRETSFLPFVAILRGKQVLALRELHVGALALALVLFFLARNFHAQLFGA